MKKFLFLMGIVVLIYSCQSSQNEVNSDLINNPLSANNSSDTSILPKFKWREEVYDFGVIIQGEKVSHTFVFKNVGKSNLIISSVYASCGCTVAKYDKKPIAPGEEGSIEVVFDSVGRNGIQNKTITVVANTQPNKVELHITAEVVQPES
jgi:hypothetical protein